MSKVKGFEDTINWYDANAEHYAKNIETVSNPELLDEFAKVVGGDRKVLDAGCAGGRDSRLLKDLGLKPIGVDLSKSLLEVARGKHSDIEFKYGNFLNLPFEDEVFDGVWAHASLLHFETTNDVRKALQEFSRVLKQGGVIHIFVKQQLGKEKTAVVSDKLSKHDRFFQWFTKNEVGILLEEVGFIIIDLKDNYPDPADREEVKWVLALARKK